MNLRYTDIAQRVLANARMSALKYQHKFIGTEHILEALLMETNSIAVTVLNNLNVDIELLRKEINNKMPLTGSGVTEEDLDYSIKAQKSLDLANNEAFLMGSNRIGTEHLLIGLMAEASGVAFQVLSHFKLTLVDLRRAVNQVVRGVNAENFGKQTQNKQHKPSSKQQDSDNSSDTDDVLEKYCRDLTFLASMGTLDPIIGRTDEIERVIRILCRRRKNNPVLIGEPGVGKTAIVEGLAQLIINNKVPNVLANKKILSLDLAAIIAGTKYRGQFEERMKKIIHELKDTNNIILFIDELHTIIGAGGAEGAIDASSMLKPALSRGEIQCIGATTIDEYRKYVEKDGALERRFQPVLVESPTVEETIEILKGLKERYEEFHELKIMDESLEASAFLAERYITDRALPDKAIDVLDEACAKVKLDYSVLPEEANEKMEELENVIEQKDKAIQMQDYEEAAKLRDKEKKIKELINVIKETWLKKLKVNLPVVTPDDIEYVVSKMTGIPVTKLIESEANELLNLEKKLSERIIGQNEAIQSLCKALMRSRAGLKDPNRPIGSFIFLGPTGVGKTELARKLAEFYYKDKESLIRIDMSEYMEKFAVSRLVGAPPGYVGYEEGGLLTEKVRRKPYSVVLFDEIEKAHADIYNILLQILDDGIITDSFGRKISFKNTILIMTSNVGARDIVLNQNVGFRKLDDISNYDEMKSKLLEDVKRVFNPEFINRVTDIIVFHSLSKDDIFKIIDVLLSETKNRVREKKIELILDETAKLFLLEKGYDKDYGARPMRRAIEKYIEDPFAEAILSGKIEKGDKVRILCENNKLVFRKE